MTSNPGTFNPIHIPNVNINSLTMATIADALWSVDKDRFQNGEITLNYGSKTHSGSQTDVSYQPYVFQYDGRKLFYLTTHSTHSPNMMEIYKYKIDYCCIVRCINIKYVIIEL